MYVFLSFKIFLILTYINLIDGYRIGKSDNESDVKNKSLMYSNKENIHRSKNIIN